MSSSAKNSLEQLYRDFLATGNEAALELWMRRSSPTLRRQAMRLGASPADADDLLQETFVAAIQGADRYDPSRPIMPWLKGILTFRAARMARDDVRRRRLYEASQPQRIAAAEFADEVSDELDRDVRQAIDDLPEHYREPLLQHLLANRSPLEIATDLGVARATVRVRLHRGLKRLRDALQRWSLLAAATLLGRRASAAVPAAFALLAIAVWVAVMPKDAHRSAPGEMAQLSSTMQPRRQVTAEPTNVALPSERTLDRPGAKSPPQPRQDTPASSVGAQRPAALTVLVDDAHGEPMPAVGLTLEPQAAQDPVLHRRSLVTDADGRASWPDLPPGRWQLRTDRGQQATIVTAGVALQHRLSVGEQRRVVGRVVDLVGNPVANARIWLSSDTSGPWRGQDVTQSDNNGRFELRAVPEGAFLAARHARLARSEVQRVHHPAPTQPSDPIRLQLGGPGARLQVLVTDEQDNPIAAAAVHVGDSMDAEPLWLAQGAAPWRAPPCVARTGADGVVETAALEPGAHPVFVRVAGLAPHRSTVEVSAQGDLQHIVRLQQGAQVAGRVQNEHGEPIPDAAVAFRHAYLSNSFDLRTDNQGAFDLQCLPTGAGDFFVTASGHVAAVASVTLARGEHRILQVTLPRAETCSGTITLGNQPAPAGVQVRTLWAPHALREPMAVTATDSGGQFAFTGRGHERPRFLVRLAPEPIWRDATPWTQWVDRAVVIHLPGSFAATSWMHGRCTSDDGQPICNARIFLHRNGRRWAEVGCTDAQGNYRIGPLPAPANYRVFAESVRSLQPTVCGPELRLLANTDTVANLTAATTGEVLVALTRNDGQPVQDVLMTVQRSDLARRFAVRNQNSMRQRLEAGDYILSIMGSSVQWIDRHAFTVQPGATTRVAIELRAASQCTLVPQGFPKREEHQPSKILLRSTHGDPWQATVNLLPGAPLRIGAVLPPGSYALSHETPAQELWRGTFSIGSERRTTAPIVVPMHRIRTSTVVRSSHGR